MAELLIKAQAHWKDSFDQKTIDNMSKDEKQSFDARSQIGDIIVVRPDGWKWGKEECLPRFVVVKVKDSFEEAKKYEEPLTEEYDETVDGKTETMSRVLKTRKYCITSADVTSISEEVKDFEEITAVDLEATIEEKLSGDTVKENS